MTKEEDYDHLVPKKITIFQMIELTTKRTGIRNIAII